MLSAIRDVSDFSIAVLADALFELGIPIVLVLQGGRPFAIPDYYAKSSAVLETVIYALLARRIFLMFVILQFFPGQSGGQAISDVLFGEMNPGGRMPLSVPFSAASLPSFYKYGAHKYSFVAR